MCLAYEGISPGALVNQIVTGIFLTMHYKPGAETAFASVEYIMRDVPAGWLIRYMHTTGASLFFIVIYLHMFRGLMYGSGKKPRELGVGARHGDLPDLHGRSFHGLHPAVRQLELPRRQGDHQTCSARSRTCGSTLTEWIRGDFVVGDATLNRSSPCTWSRCPLVLAAAGRAAPGRAARIGSNNPDGVDIKKGPKGNRWSSKAPTDGIPFHPYYTVKDLFGVACFLTIAAFNHLLRTDRRRLVPGTGTTSPPADPLVTPEQHQAGVVLHALLRDVARGALVRGHPDWGVIVMGAAG